MIKKILEEDMNKKDKQDKVLESKNISKQYSLKEMEELKDKLLRALAEVDNIRKRSIKDREEYLQYSIMNFARDMLSVQDNFQRALESIENIDLTKVDVLELQNSFLKGIKMTFQGFISVLEKHAVKEINPLYSKFNSNFHHSIFEENTDKYPSGIVVKVLRKGYVLNNRLIRPAMVSISKNNNHKN